MLESVKEMQKGPGVLQGPADIVGAKAGEGTTLGINTGGRRGKGVETNSKEET